MKVKLGTRELTFPSNYLRELEPCNHLLSDVSLLQDFLHDKGYLYLTNFHDRADVLQARSTVLEYINSLGEDKLDPNYKVDDGILNPNCDIGCVPFMEGVAKITHSANVKAVLEGERPFNFFKRYFGCETLTFDFKWLRAMPLMAFTGAHVDNVYMSRGSSNVLTMWTPLGDVSPDMGTLAVCEGSNHLPSFRDLHDTYSKLDIEASNLTGTGWFTEDPWEITSKFGGIWKTANFKAGDVIIFTLKTIHMSTVNLTRFARISCDTRWQPAMEKVDARYMGIRDSPQVKSKYGAWATKDKNDGPTIDQLKKSWGF